MQETKMRKAIILILLLLCSLALAQQEKPYRILNSFSAGELSELLLAREDLSKYHSGCSVMENMIPLPQGGAQKRPGTVYVAESKNNTKIRLLPFEYSTEQSYIIELGNQYARFYTNNAVIYETYGTEDLSGIGSIVAHWKCDDNAATTAVVDDDGATHNGVANANTNTFTTTNAEGTANSAFDLGGTAIVSIADHADFTFGDGSNDSPFSLMAWVYVTATASKQGIINKWGGDEKEWALALTSTETIEFRVYDESANKEAKTTTNNSFSAGWHFVVTTYNGLGGASAADGMKIYVDWVEEETTKTNDASYVAMEDKGSPSYIGADEGGSYKWQDKIDNVAVFNKELTAVEVASLTGAASTTVYEIATPYLTADLFELKFEQSADVLYVVHPDYETRKLSRLANAIWSLEAYATETGPFRDQNTDTNAKIAASATTGSVTLTATGCAPFVSGTTAGHLPSGSATTSKSQTGALFRLVHPLTNLEHTTELDDNYTNDPTENVSWLDCATLYKGDTWYLTTLGTWTGVLELQRNYTVGAAHNASGWEKVFAFASTDDRNVDTSGTETLADASYRAILTQSGDAAEQCKVYFRSNATDHIGIVEITAVASTTSATATVLTTLGSTDATHKWSEGSWSNYRGWPRTVTFFEDRLTFGGNAGQPDTIWASVTADYENMLAGAEDDDALNFTLSSRQVNVIEWLIGKDKILIGTSGAEWTLGGSADEPLTPSNVKAEQHSTYGSAGLQATLASESVLFFQRGAKKMRELAYNWELDSYVAPDMTILVPEVTGDGITDTAFQKTPNSILWCIKDNGDIAIFVYERKEQITSWSRLITDDDFESVAVITGDPEDEVWVSVKRTIGGADQRYIEYFSDRDFGTDVTDAFYVDSGITDTGGSTTVSGLDHLEGEDVIVLGDGVVQTEATAGDFTVSGGDITVASGLTTVQAGLPYTVQMKTMPLSWVAAGMTIQGRIKRINEVIAQYYDSGDFDIGKDTTDKKTLSVSGMATDSGRMTFPAGYDRPGYVFIYQQSPEPLTLIALMIEFMVY